MNNIAVSQTRKDMTRDKFIASLSDVREKLDDQSMSCREIKVLYFSLNLDYIKLCESMKFMNYYPSKTCDERMRNCMNDSSRAEAVEIIKARIIEISNSLS